MSTNDYRPSVSDRVGIIFFIIVGAVIIVWGAIAAAARISDLIRGEGIAATVGFVDTAVGAPIGPGGALLPVQLDTGTVTATELTGAGFGAAVLGQLIAFATVTTVVVCLTLLARNTLRGRIFSRSNTRLITTAGMTALVGFGLSPLFEGMVANDIIARLSNGDFQDSAVLMLEPLPFVLLAFAFGIVATAYTVGARIQRETEGLI
ncbi:MAG: hypothetical protein KDB25_05170 [Leucobacter sp.]|nr:hypothetical protein [Leucobacter sp.]